METEVLQNIANYGFPAVVCLYLLIRIEGKMEKLSVAINDLNKTITLILKDK